MSEFRKLINNKQEGQKTTHLKIEDRESRRSYIKIIKRDSVSAAFSFVITCDMILINETPYSLDIRGCDSLRKNSRVLLPKIPGERVCLLSSCMSSFEIKLSDTHKECMRFFSKKFTSKIKTSAYDDETMLLNLSEQRLKKKVLIGQDNILPSSADIKGRFTSLEMGCFVDFLSHRKGFGIKTFLLGAKTVIANKSGNGLRLWQKDSYSMQVDPFQRKPIYIFKGKNAKEKHFYVEMEKEGLKYKSFVPLDLDSFGSLSIYLINKEKHKYIILRLEVMMVKGYTFAQFEDRTDQRDLVFKNNLGITVCIFQRKHEDAWFVVLGPRETGEISWVNPYVKKELTVQIYLFDKKKISQKEIKSHREAIRPEKNVSQNILNPLTDFIFEKDKKSKESLGKPYDQFSLLIERIRKKVFRTTKGKEILINVKLEGSSRMVLIETVRRNIEEKTLEEFDVRVGSSEVFTFIFHFKQFGLSFVDSFGRSRKEIFYLRAHEVNFLGETEEKNLKCQFQIRYLNLDNNFSSELPFEVGLTSNQPEPTLIAQNNYVLNVIFIVKNEKRIENQDIMVNGTNQKESIICLDEITIELSPLVLRMDSETLMVFEILGRKVYGLFFASSLADDLTKYFNPEDHLKQVQWEKISLDRDHWIYCKNFSVSLLKAIVTYRKADEQIIFAKNLNENQGLMLQSLTKTLPNFDDSPLNFKGIELFYVFESSNGLLSLYLHHLKMQWRMNVMKLLGSLNFLGNPTNLFGNVGNGMVQFVEKPVKGFKKGPISGVKGGLYGSKALLQNTTVGVMTAVSKFTGSLASGFSSLTHDKEFSRSRHMAKPKNALSGMKNGATSIGKGLWSGATGIFTQPVKGMKKSGAKGFMKGMFKGITGIVTKPVSGILDAASQTTQGVSGSLTKKEDMPNEDRLRPPRVLFSRIKLIKEYNPSNTQIFWQAVKLKSSIKSSFLVDAFETTIKLPNQKLKTIVMITGKNLYCFSDKMDKILAVVSLSSIYNFESNINEAVIEIASRAQNQKIELHILCLIKEESVSLVLEDAEFKIVQMIKTILKAKYFI